MSDLDDILAQLELQAVEAAPPTAANLQRQPLQAQPSTNLQRQALNVTPQANPQQRVQTISQQTPTPAPAPEKKSSHKSSGEKKSSSRSKPSSSGKSSTSKSSHTRSSSASKDVGTVIPPKPKSTQEGDEWNDEMADILGIDFSSGPKSGETHPYGANMLEMLGFTKFDPRKALAYDEDDNTADTFSVRGTDTTLVGEVHFVNLVSLNEDGEQVALKCPEKYISTEIVSQTTGLAIQGWYRDNGDKTLALGFYAETAGDIQFTVNLTGNPIISLTMHVSEAGDVKQWFCAYQRPVMGEVWKINIARKDGKHPEGTVDLMAERTTTLANFKIKKVGPAKYRITCIPIKAAAVQVHITLLGEHISGSPIQTFVQDPDAIETGPIGANWAETLEAVNLTPATLEPEGAVTLKPQDATFLNAMAGDSGVNPGMGGGMMGGQGIPMNPQMGMGMGMNPGMGGGMMGGQMGMGGTPIKDFLMQLGMNPMMATQIQANPMMIQQTGLPMPVVQQVMMMAQQQQMMQGGGMMSGMNPMMGMGGMMGQMGMNPMMAQGMGGAGMMGPGMMGPGMMGQGMANPGMMTNSGMMGPGMMGQGMANPGMMTNPAMMGGPGMMGQGMANPGMMTNPAGKPRAQPQQVQQAPNDDELAALLGDLGGSVPQSQTVASQNSANSDELANLLGELGGVASAPPPRMSTGNSELADLLAELS